MGMLAVPSEMVFENGRAMHEKDSFRYRAHFERTWSIWLFFFFSTWYLPVKDPVPCKKYSDVPHVKLTLSK